MSARLALAALAVACLAVACLAVACLAATVAPAAQAGWIDVIRDCAEDGAVGDRYTRGELKNALRRIPADLDEYSECRSAITAAIGSGGEPAGGKPEPARKGSGAAEGAASEGVSASGASSRRRANGAARASDRVDRAEPDETVAGSLLSGAEAIGAAPLEVVGAAAGGRLGVPGYVWALLIAAGLAGVGAVREYRTTAAE